MLRVKLKSQKDRCPHSLGKNANSSFSAATIRDQKRYAPQDAKTEVAQIKPEQFLPEERSLIKTFLD